MRSNGISMKLSEWARKQGISYKTAWKWYKEKLAVPAYQKSKEAGSLE